MSEQSNVRIIYCPDELLSILNTKRNAVNINEEKIGSYLPSHEISE